MTRRSCNSALKGVPRAATVGFCAARVAAALELAEFGAAGFLLEDGEVDAKGLVLALEGFEFGLLRFLAGCLDGHLGVEMGPEVADFPFKALDFAGGVAAGGEARFPDEGGAEESGGEAPGEGVVENVLKEWVHGSEMAGVASWSSAIALRSSSARWSRRMALWRSVISFRRAAVEGSGW